MSRENGVQLDAGEVEPGLLALEFEVAARAWTEFMAEHELEAGLVNDIDNHAIEASTTAEEGAGDISSQLPHRPIMSRPSSNAISRPSSIHLEPDHMFDPLLDAPPQLAAQGAREMAENRRNGATRVESNQQGSPIDENMSWEEFVRGFDEDARELSTDGLPWPAVEDEEPHRGRSRHRRRGEMTAEEEYTEAYRTLDAGWQTGEERVGQQMRVQMAMDRVKREEAEKTLSSRMWC